MSAVTTHDEQVCATCWGPDAPSFGDGVGFEPGTCDRCGREGIVFDVALCPCGNVADHDGVVCEWCVPHNHPPVHRRHQFGASMICADCRMMAQDCCEAASPCSADAPEPWKGWR